MDIRGDCPTPPHLCYRRIAGVLLCGCVCHVYYDVVFVLSFYFVCFTMMMMMLDDKICVCVCTRHPRDHLSFKNEVAVVCY